MVRWLVLSLLIFVEINELWLPRAPPCDKKDPEDDDQHGDCVEQEEGGGNNQASKVEPVLTEEKTKGRYGKADDRHDHDSPAQAVDHPSNHFISLERTF